MKVYVWTLLDYFVENAGVDGWCIVRAAVQKLLVVIDHAGEGSFLFDPLQVVLAR